MKPRTYACRAACQPCAGSVETGGGIGWPSNRIPRPASAAGKVLKGNQTQGSNGSQRPEMEVETTDSLVEQSLEGALTGTNNLFGGGEVQVGVAESQGADRSAGNSGRRQRGETSPGKAAFESSCGAHMQLAVCANRQQCRLGRHRGQPRCIRSSNIGHDIRVSGHGVKGPGELRRCERRQTEQSAGFPEGSAGAQLATACGRQTPPFNRAHG